MIKAEVHPIRSLTNRSSNCPREKKEKKFLKLSKNLIFTLMISSIGITLLSSKSNYLVLNKYQIHHIVELRSD